jgi:tetratricopeptide (TPR) repeat protein
VARLPDAPDVSSRARAPHEAVAAERGAAHRPRRPLLLLAALAWRRLPLRSAPTCRAPKAAAIYGRILNAELDAAGAAAPRASASRARAHARRIFWRIQLDPDSRALDGAFTRVVEEAIARNEAWVAREPRRAEAWFYLGGAYGARAQWRVLRLERLAAARDGKRIKESLERALALDPALDDAQFGIGLYQYYADIAPAVAKFLRILLLLPGGDKVEGLQRMLRARERGKVMRAEADFQLHVIYLWYERDFRKALAYLRGLDRSFPRNPLFVQSIAEINDTYVYDRTESLVQWRVLPGVRCGARRQRGPLAEARARLRHRAAARCARADRPGYRRDSTRW